MGRKNISSGAPWEAKVGYSRAVAIGDWVEVTGTVAVDGEGHVVGPMDPYAQTQFAIQKIGEALAEAGASLAQVVRTRIYVTNIDHWELVGRAHAEAFGDIRPATTMVEVSRLISPEYLVEVEARAYLGD